MEKQWLSAITAVNCPKLYYQLTYVDYRTDIINSRGIPSRMPLLFYVGLSYSNLMALVGSIFDMSIDGSTRIAVEIMNIAMFIGISNQLNSMGTLSM